MFAENRRQERRINDLCALLEKQGYQYGQIEHLAPMDEKVEILEGTGALVIDHKNGSLIQLTLHLDSTIIIIYDTMNNG